MLDKFKKIGQLKKLRDQAMKLQKALDKEELTIEKGNVEVIITGSQKFKEVKIDGGLQPVLIKALNEAIKKSQKIAAKRMQSMGGDFGLPGLG